MGVYRVISGIHREYIGIMQKKMERDLTSLHI